ncbi:MAG TPA: SURF1 family protein [Rhizobiaceae bacterium]|nr:SURF1 family protein [Rhizobiaceae bacterium]
MSEAPTDRPQQTAAAPRRLWPLLVASTVVFVVLCALGAWQVQRLAWKEGLLAEIAKRTASAPVAIAEITQRLADGRPVEYQPVEVSGVFDHSAEQYFLATHQGQSGWYVYAPLRLDDGRHVFVNRGFVHYDQRDPSRRPGSQPHGRQEIAGLARAPLTGKPSSLVPDNRPEKREFYWKDLAAMTRSAGLGPQQVLPVFIDAGFPAKRHDPAMLPQPGVTIVDLPNNHLQYAVTWFGLAAVLAVVTGLLAWRRLRAYDD